MLDATLLENLDGMDASELREYARRLNAEPSTPGSDDNLTRESLRSYALNKAEAMGHRAAGNIREAQRLEDMADVTYHQLPRYARW